MLLLLLAGAAAVPARAQQIDVIRPSGRWVTDLGEILSSSEERVLSEKLRAYADTTSTQIVIVTLPDLDGAEAADYAVTLGREWQVGQEGQDNGVVILVSRDDRQAHIATGYGLEGAIPDAVAARIYRNILVPNFREGRFFTGLSAASDALIAAARGEYTAEASPRRARRADDGLDGATLFVLMIIAYFVLSAIRRGGRGGGGGGGRRYRRGRGFPPIIIWGGGLGGGGGFGGGGFGGGGFGGGGFGGGGGSFGGGGAGGGW